MLRDFGLFSCPDGFFCNGLGRRSLVECESPPDSGARGPLSHVPERTRRNRSAVKVRANGSLASGFPRSIRMNQRRISTSEFRAKRACPVVALSADGSTTTPSGGHAPLYELLDQWQRLGRSYAVACAHNGIQELCGSLRMSALLPSPRLSPASKRDRVPLSGERNKGNVPYAQSIDGTQMWSVLDDSIEQGSMPGVERVETRQGFARDEHILCRVREMFAIVCRRNTLLPAPNS